jgi:hypothetical protein
MSLAMIHTGVAGTIANSNHEMIRKRRVNVGFVKARGRVSTLVISRLLALPGHMAMPIALIANNVKDVSESGNGEDHAENERA